MDILYLKMPALKSKKSRKQKIRELYLDGFNQKIQNFNGYEKDGYTRDNESSDSSSIDSDGHGMSFESALGSSTSDVTNCLCVFLGIAIVAAIVTVIILNH
mgnify:CR=1 FL=1